MNPNEKIGASKYPLFIKPEEHRLFDYYKRLERWGFILLPIIFLCNEFVLRPILIAQDSRSNLLLWLAYIVNLDFPSEVGAIVLNGVIFLSLTLCLVAYNQPKWGERENARNMKAGVPIHLNDYRKAVFLVRNVLQSIAFNLYHKVLMKIAFLGCLVSVTGVFNLLRSL